MPIIIWAYFRLQSYFNLFDQMTWITIFILILDQASARGRLALIVAQLKALVMRLTSSWYKFHICGITKLCSCCVIDLQTKRQIVEAALV